VWSQNGDRPHSMRGVPVSVVYPGAMSTSGGRVVRRSHCASTLATAGFAAALALFSGCDHGDVRQGSRSLIGSRDVAA
jgi:hypothetical protein